MIEWSDIFSVLLFFLSGMFALSLILIGVKIRGVFVKGRNHDE